MKWFMIFVMFSMVACSKPAPISDKSVLDQISEFNDAPLRAIEAAKAANKAR